MNETLKVLETRRSCRNFKPDMIKAEDLDAIIKAGTYAATGMGKQSPMASYQLMVDIFKFPRFFYPDLLMALA